MWWLACVTKSLPDSEEVEVSFLHPYKPAKYPFSDDVLVMSYHDVLTLVNPSTATGRDYVLLELEMMVASTTLSSKRY